MFACHRLLFKLLLLGFAFSIPVSSFAWYALGHMVVADIAYQHLTSTARIEVDKLRNAFGKEYPELGSFEQMAIWPDELRKQNIDMFSHWHYIDLAFSHDGTPVKHIADSDNAVWALEKMTAVIRNKQANPFERARFLAFFAHIVGDLHQPLHTTARISAQYPDGDQGGNLFYVRFNGKRKNLHSIWDGVFDEMAGEPNVNVAHSHALRLMAQYPQTFFAHKIDNLNIASWAQEGLFYAKQYAYNTEEEKNLNTAYVKGGKDFAEQQLVLAGYRLAAELNLLLG
jgi:hypothetical protein